MKAKNLTCITCPLGCTITVRLDHGQILDISGNTCKRGEDYARREILNPSRTVTTTVRAENGTDKRIPVRTEQEIPKDKIMECMKCIRKISVKTPVHIGDVVLADVAGTGINVIATKNVM